MAEANKNTHNKRSLIRTFHVCQRLRAAGRNQQVEGYKHTHTHTPATSGGRDCKLSVNSANVTTTYALCEKLPYLRCGDEFLQLATLIMRDSNLSMPVTTQEGKELFKYIMNEIEQP